MVVPQQVFAWSDAGHRIIASIAFRQLAPDEQEKVVSILKCHPRFVQDFEDRMPDGLTSEAEIDEWIFQQAAVWPDLVKAFSGEQRQKFHRPTWHYINVHHFLTDADRDVMEGGLNVNLSLEAPSVSESGMNIVQTIRYARSLLADEDADEAEKAVMLC